MAKSSLAIPINRAAWQVSISKANAFFSKLLKERDRKINSLERKAITENGYERRRRNREQRNSLIQDISKAGEESLTNIKGIGNKDAVLDTMASRKWLPPTRVLRSKRRAKN